MPSMQPSCDLEVHSITGYTPLHGAVVKGITDMIEVLVSHGADVNAVDVRGDTPLHLNFLLYKILFYHCGTSPIMQEVCSGL